MATEGFDKNSKGKEFFRCTTCGNVVSHWDIEKHKGCAKCGGPRITPTNLTIIEKIIQLFKHPAIWKWGRDV